MKRKKKILIVEDDVHLAGITKLILEKKGYDASIADNGEAGLTAARRDNPDLIILDLCLPKIKGEEVCREIRRDEKMGATPIIMVTAKDLDADRIIGRVIGANSYMTKPFEMANLLKEIDKLIGIKTQGDAGEKDQGR